MSMTKKNFYTVAYHHNDTGETVTRYCETKKSAKDWAVWLEKQAWVEPNSVKIYLGQPGR